MCMLICIYYTILPIRRGAYYRMVPSRDLSVRFVRALSPEVRLIRPWADAGPHAPPHYLHSLVFSFTPGSVDLEKAC